MRSLEPGRCRSASAVLALLAMFMAHGAAASAAAERTAGLSARLTLHDRTGRSIAAAQHEQAFRLRVSLTDVVTGKPARGLQLNGWIRRVDRLNGTCEDEARAFRATRAIARNAIDLNGVIVSVLNEDASFGIVDPKLNGQPATMLAAATLDRMPAAFAIDRANMRAVFAFEDGKVEDVSLADGTRRVIADGLRQPAAIAATTTGDIWVAKKATGTIGRMRQGGLADTISVGGPGRLILHQNSATGLLGAVSEDGGVVLFDGATGDRRFQGRLKAPVADAVFVGEDGILFLSPQSDRAELRYFNDFGTALHIPLGLAPTRIVLSPDARIALAFTPGQPGVAIIDIATARMVQTVALNDAAIAEIAFTDRAAFLATVGGQYIGVLDLKSVAAGKTPVIRPVPLGGNGGSLNPDRKLLASLLPSPQILAVDRERMTGWLIPELAAVGNIPPMDAVRLPGGLPLQVQVVDRSFRETEAGRFETVARIRGGGEHELVLTTGIAGLTTCIRFNVEGPAAAPANRLYSLSMNPDAAYRTGTEQDLEIAFKDEDGQTLDIEEARFLIPSLLSGWSAQIVMYRGTDGKLRGKLRFPHPGPYALQPMDSPAGWKLKSVPTIEVTL